MALIDANARLGKTHLDNFVPFALEALRAANGEPLSPGQVADIVAAEFGLRVPGHAMESVLRRATRGRLAVRKSNRYTLRDDIPATLKNLKSEQARFLREQTGLCEKFVKYCSEVHSVAISLKDAETALYDQVERNTVALLSVEFAGASYGNQEKVGVEHTYLAADFIAHVTKADPIAYEWLVAAAKGAMLSAVLHLPNEFQVSRRFSNTELYLDAPLLLKISGLEGEEAEQSALEVVRSARLFGAKLAAFAHSVSEAEGVIAASADARRRGRSMPHRSTGVLAHAIQTDLGATDLELRYAKFSSDISGLGIAIREKPDAITHLEVDELALTEQLRESVGYRYEGALYKDVDSLRGIHFIRRGRAGSTFIEDSRAVLITDNEAVVGVARRFFRGEGYGWPVATLISDLATLLYIKEPQKSPEIPRLQMVAGAYSALEPGPAVWNAWLEAIEQQVKTNSVSGDDIALLCHTRESRRILMQVTLGDATKVGADTVQDVLSETRRRVAAPYEAIARAHESESIKASAQAEVLGKAMQDAEGELQEIRSELDDIKSKNQKYIVNEASRQQAIICSAKKYASRWVTGLLLFLVIVTGSWAVLSLVNVLPASNLTVIASIVAVIGTVLSALQQLFGGDVKRWMGPLEKRIVERRVKKLNTIIGMVNNPENAQ